MSEAPLKNFRSLDAKITATIYLLRFGVVALVGLILDGLVGAAIFFLVTLETRVKRRRALKAIHELRSIARTSSTCTSSPRTSSSFCTGDEMRGSVSTIAGACLEISPSAIRNHLLIASIWSRSFDAGAARANNGGGLGQSTRRFVGSGVYSAGLSD